MTRADRQKVPCVLKDEGTKGDLVRWRVTAGIKGISLSEWIRCMCNEVAIDQETLDAIRRDVALKNASRERTTKR